MVPGEPDVEPLPDPGTDPSDAAELAAGWLARWYALIGLPLLSLPVDPAHPPTLLAFLRPDRHGLAAWPALQRAVTPRWRQAQDWHNVCMKVGLEAGLHRDRRTGQW